jgi:hypothetical protein
MHGAAPKPYQERTPHIILFEMNQAGELPIKLKTR